MPHGKKTPRAPSRGGSEHARRRARARLGGVIDLWLAANEVGGRIEEARSVASAVGVPYVAAALLRSLPPLTIEDLEEWENWPGREDFLIALGHRIRTKTTRPGGGTSSVGSPNQSRALPRQEEASASFVAQGAER